MKMHLILIPILVAVAGCGGKSGKQNSPNQPISMYDATITLGNDPEALDRSFERTFDQPKSGTFTIEIEAQNEAPEVQITVFVKDSKKNQNKVLRGEVAKKIKMDVPWGGGNEGLTLGFEPNPIVDETVGVKDAPGGDYEVQVLFRPN